MALNKVKQAILIKLKANFIQLKISLGLKNINEKVSFINSYLEVSNLVQYGRTKCSNDWAVSEIYPQFHRLYYAYSGEVLYKSSEEDFYLKNNKLYLFPVYKEYKMTQNPSSPLCCLWFHINLNNTLLNNVIEINIHNDSAEFYLIKALEKMIKENRDTYIIKNLLNSLLLIVEKNEKLVYVMDDRLDKVINYIHNNYGCSIKNSQLAKLLNIDTRYFIRLFKKNYGQTPQAYLSSYRAFQAANYLRKGIQIKEVAVKTGFEDAKAFSRFFKNQSGITPSEYRKGYYQQP